MQETLTVKLNLNFITSVQHVRKVFRFQHSELCNAVSYMRFVGDGLQSVCGGALQGLTHTHSASLPVQDFPDDS